MDLQALKNKYDIIGNDPALNQALETAVKFAPTDLSVVILGESGVGKENFARIIHQYSARRNNSFFVVNCGALAKELVNSELFGHVKGSFTGSTETRKGYFEDANGGTLFLDEIAELPLESQVLLLRVLQSGEYRKVGSNKIEHTDVRIVAVTNIDLYEAVRRGKFREDLYFRLSAAQVRIPALRDRHEDIYLLFRKFTSDFSEKYNLCKVSLSHDAISLLTAYRWPGNIRQLKNIAETVTALESRPVTPSSERIEIGPAALMRYLPDEKDSMLPAPAGPAPAGGGMSDNDKQMIVKALLDLKQEVDRLKSIVEAGPGAAPATGPAALPHYMGIPQENEPEEQMIEPEAAAASVPEGLSMRKAGDELIERALAKHGGKVKPAAAELGISERTIYRKLAEWKEKGRKP